MPTSQTNDQSDDHSDNGDDDSRAAIVAAHDAALKGGQLGYLDPNTGLFVMTAQYLRDRGYCCDRGCRHCPYS